MSEIDNSFKFCPKCGGQNISYQDNRKWGCADCGFKLYNNVAAAVGLVLTDSENNVIFETRAKEPRKGFLALPGGFCDLDETAENAVVRECREEIGLEISEKDIQFLCTFPNTYDYKNIRYKTCDMFFEAKIKNCSAEDLLKKSKIQKTEVLGLCVKSVKSEKDVDELPLAFDSAKKTLKLWLSKK